MSETQITELLNQLAEVRAKLDLIRLDCDTAMEAATPMEVRQAFADIEEEYEPMLAEANNQVAQLESAIKSAVIEHGASVKTNRVQAVYVKGRVTWNTDSLDGYAIEHPELFAFRAEKEPTAQIRWR